MSTEEQATVTLTPDEIGVSSENAMKTVEEIANQSIN
jgi:hypothetical protein